jgi:ABC-2 type transport system permease protein
MRGLADIYARQLSASLASMLQYRASLLIWQIGGILTPLVSMLVWMAAARSGGGSIGGYSAGDFAAYYIALLVVNQLTSTWIMFEMEYRVKSGSFSFALLKPVHPIHSDVADILASKIVNLPFLILTVAVFSFLFRPSFHLSAWAVAASVVSLACACAARIVLEWTLSLAAFWTTRVSAVNQLWFIAAFFLSGQMAPLELMPSPVRVMASVLPFRWIISFPVELFLGRLSPAQAAQGIAAEAAWLLAGALLLAWVWRAGLKAYSAVGS